MSVGAGIVCGEELACAGYRAGALDGRGGIENNSGGSMR